MSSICRKPSLFVRDGRSFVLVEGWERSLETPLLTFPRKPCPHERLEEREAAADNGDVEFKAGPDGLLGARG